MSNRINVRRRGQRIRSEGRWLALPIGQSKAWQRIRHKQRRALVSRLLASGRWDDIPGNTPRHVRWDYW